MVPRQVSGWHLLQDRTAGSGRRREGVGRGGPLGGVAAQEGGHGGDPTAFHE